MRRIKSKYDIDRILKKYWGIDRPENVEHTIANYWKTEDKEKRKRLYELIQLERAIAEYGKLLNFNN